ncbi:MAG: S-layer protein [Blastopirellula sp.]|nr:S-layer protein [Blastopirellula sp.]
MNRSPVLLACATLLIACGAVLGQDDFPGLGPIGTLSGLEFSPTDNLVLRGVNDRAQLVVSGKYTSGQLHDLTHQVTYQSAPSGIVQIDRSGFVTPLADGKVTITVRSQEGTTAALSCQVENFANPRPINFADEVTPIFTKLGCNAGGCHGKSGGQNGFKLSLLGFYPEEDYEWLVKENRGRRIFPAAPEFSLLLTKPLNQLPHGGGKRLEKDSYEYELLTRWIEQGMPYGSEDDPIVERIDVLPKTRAMNRGTAQQLRVVAHYSDNSIRDVSRLASFESNDSEMAHVSERGRVNVFDRPGEAAIMVRFQGVVDVFRATVPLGLPVTQLPPTKNLVDQHVFGKLKQLGIPPSALCDDSTFVRRAYIDITGRIPTADQARSFVESKSPQKRDQLIDALLASPGYGDYFANKWTMVLRNKRAANNTAPSFKFHDWVRRQLQLNVPYDQFVRGVLASSGDIDANPTTYWYTNVTTANAQAEDAAQLFLGLRVQCARCHHHPFEKWSQNDYYGFQAFFSRVGRKNSRRGLQNGNIFHDPGKATARNPRTQADLTPTGLGSPALELPPYEDPRHALVDWMAQPENPFFAPALVNRYWKHFFGRGIVDPEDDMRVTNPPTNPELLDALAKSFIASKFDLKQLVRTICTSSTYQLSSEPTKFNQDDNQNFSRFYPRRLNAEPLYDAINQFTNTSVVFTGMPAGTRAVQLPDSGFNDYFLTVFGTPQAESACECERNDGANLAQALHLLNSADVQGKLATNQGRANLLVTDTERTDAEKVTELYYWAFARPPRDSELDFVLKYLSRKANKKQAYEDILWAMLNTKEFLFNR